MTGELGVGVHGGPPSGSSSSAEHIYLHWLHWHLNEGSRERMGGAKGAMLKGQEAVFEDWTALACDRALDAHISILTLITIEDLKLHM